MNAAANIAEIIIPQPSESKVTDAQVTLQTIRALHITDASSAVDIQERRQAINTRIKELNAERTKMTKPIDESKARIMAFFARPIEFLELALKHCDAEIVAHNRRVEDERREAQRKADLEAQRERQRLAAIAEESRQRDVAAQRARDLEAQQRREAAAAEQRRLDEAAEEARRAGDAEAARVAEQERLRVEEETAEADREAQRAAEASRLTTEAKAELFDNRAATTVAPVAIAEAPKVKGVSMRDNWVFTIKDPAKINAPYMTPDTVKIGKLVKALHLEAAEQIGEGIEIRNEQVVASRRAGA